MKKIRVIELFAGVGGFRLGFSQVNHKEFYEFTWFNQWEPNTKKQHAYDTYLSNFKDLETNYSNEDIASVNSKNIPDHDLLVGGFPCQDYSVARSLVGEKGLEGKKGVLFWEIYRILKEKKTKYFLLENVDRLVKSPSFQKGRDFLVMLKALNDLGYMVEWRIVKSSDYGDIQNRRRIYIFGASNTSKYYIRNFKNESPKFKLFEKIFAAKSIKEEIYNFADKDIYTISEYEKFNFFNSGICLNNKIVTYQVEPIKVQPIALKEILESEIPDKFYLSESQIEKVTLLKSKKRILRNSNGFQYYFSEGKLSFPDDSMKPARTILTSEGQINRSSHFVSDQKGLRFLTPLEVERINGFPDNWTRKNDISNRKRYFLMGNALSVRIISMIADGIKCEINHQ